MNEIHGFFGETRWLSNFHYAPVTYDGVVYRTNEHAYQAAKHLDLDFRDVIRRYEYPRDAMKAGRSRPARPHWDDMKYQVMLTINIEKFAQEPLRTMLLETGDAHLEETNTWGDTYWGVCNGIGENNLGKILMWIRQTLRELSAQNQ